MPETERQHRHSSEKLGIETMAGILQHQIAEFYESTTRSGSSIQCEWDRYEVVEGERQLVTYEMAISVNRVARVVRT